ncbi:MAG: thiamine-phosphate kinase [Heliobacteriaceae bacterium]|nr:thiamine-phosphate kinase [Heliobacteriaceae bacterium]
MKEKEFIETIKSVTGSKYIGDDCAYIEDLGIVLTQDNLVEDVHFKLDFTTPYKLGCKSAAVNISDICASGAKPAYLTIALSLPDNIDTDFIKEFYEGAACGNVEIAGGDITGGDKIFISVSAVGSAAGRRISSRSHARAGYKVIVSGEHGSSAAGLRLLNVLEGGPEFPAGIPAGCALINAHLTPKAQCEFSEQIARQINEDYAMMDSSDGLMDALSAIAQASGVMLCIDFDKIPYNKDIEQFADYKDLILYGGEDYQLIAAVPEKLLKKIKNYTIIGEVKDGTPGVEINGKFYTRQDIETRLYDHF